MSQFESLSVDELIALALTTSNDDEDSQGDGYEAIRVLMRRGTRDVFEACRILIQTGSEHQRAVGIDVLGQLGYAQQYPFVHETLPLLFDLIENDTSIEVLQSIAAALGHLHQSKGVPYLLRLKKHPDFSIRFSVTVALRGFDRLDAIKALIKLSNDNDECIRDWATFGLGSESLRNMPEIREALYARLNDEDDETRGEALAGLAQQKDPRVFEPLLAELTRMTENGIHGMLPLEAAEKLADPRLLPVLLAYRDSWEGEKNWIYSHLEDAIAACTPATGDDDEP